MSELLHKLIRVLQLEQLDKNLFRGETWPPRTRRVFGGQVLAQAMYAAIQSVEEPERRVHSQHAYFLRPGNPDKAIIYEVDPIRDGRSFSTRRVVAIQDGKAIFNTSLSFQVPEQGHEHQAPMPDTVPPEEVESDLEYYSRINPNPEKKNTFDTEAIDYRTVDKIDMWNPQQREPRLGVWMRANGTLLDDRSVHETLLAYMSDRYLMGTALLPHALTFMDPQLMVASIDHALWFHDEFRADDWLYYDMSSTRSGHSRGINFGSIYTQDGRLVATAVQEGLMRLRE